MSAATPLHLVPANPRPPQVRSTHPVLLTLLPLLNPFRLRTLITPNHKLTVYGGKPYGELFDLERDPRELRNRFSDSSYKTLRRNLTAALLDELVLTDSVLPRRLNHA